MNLSDVPLSDLKEGGFNRACFCKLCPSDWYKYTSFMNSGEAIGITTRPNGSGIGLMLAQSAMQKHNGAIEVRSELGQSTTFVCVFPTPPIRNALSETAVVGAV